MRQPGDRAPAPGRLALVQDLINTADLEGGRDRLRTVDDLEVFCVDHRLGEIGALPADVAAARDLREALREACGAHGGTVESGAVRVLERLFGRAPLVLRLDGDGAVGTVPAAGLAGVDLLIGHAAAAIASAAAEGTWWRLKACESQPCRWAYYDNSPAGRGRWCTMSICGARAKMRAHRARR